MIRQTMIITLLGLLPFAVACQSTPGDDEPLYDSPEEYIKLANRYMTRHQFQLASKHYRLALELDRDNFEATLGAANALGYWALGLKQKPNEDLSPEQNQKRIRDLVEQSSRMYARANELKPDSPLPYKGWGRTLFDLKEVNSKFLNIAEKKLKQGVKKSRKKDMYRTEAQCYFYLGAVKYAQENMKEEGKRDFSKTRDYLFKYLNRYRDEGKTPPKEKQVEQFLMEIEEETKGS